MTRRFGILLSLLSLLLVAACSAEPDVTAQVPADQFNFAKQFLEQIRSGAVEAALNSLDPSANKDTARPFLQRTADNFPKREVRVQKVVDWSEAFQQANGQVSPASTGQPGETVIIRMIMRYVFSDTDAIDISLLIHGTGPTYSVGYLDFRPLGQNEIDAASFFAPGKSMAQFLYFMGAVAVLGFVLTTLYFCVRAQFPLWRWRWMWVLAILFPIGRWSMEWTSGNMVISPLGLVPTGVWFFKAGVYGSYIFFLGFPLGAIAYWVYRWRHHKRAKKTAVPNEIAAQ